MSMAPVVLDWLPTTSMNMLDAALIYGRHGLRVIPVHGLRDGRCTCGSSDCKPGKHPVGAAWQKRATWDEDAIRDMFRKAPSPCNIGLAMGEQASGDYLIAIDIDGEPGRTRLAELEKEHGPLPASLSSRSGRVDGGEHRILKLGVGQDPKRLANQAKLGLDRRVKGGQIVVCPSLHESGNRYSWSNAIDFAMLPDAWFEAMATPLPTPRLSKPPSNVYQIGDAYIRRVIENAVSEISSGAKGERNHRLAAKSRTVLEYCAGHGLAWEPVMRQLEDAGTECGLPTSEARKTVAKAARHVDQTGNVRRAPPPTTSASTHHASTASDEEESTELPEWRRNLLHVKGKYEECLANVITILAQHPAWQGVIQYDMFREAIVFTREPPAREQDKPKHRPQGNVWLETDDTRTQAWIHAVVGFSPGKTIVADAVAAVAERSAMHPVREYLDALVWDGKQRLPTMLSMYFGAELSAYTSGIGTIWMISGVARVVRPGEQVDYMIGLEGPQGLGKSSGLRALCPRPGWYADTGITIGQKDSYIALHGKWIFCFDELDSVRGADVTKTKAFLTSCSDNFRPPWGRRNRDYPRQTIFAYTTNEDIYLRDRTGNRRWLPFKCGPVTSDGKIDREGIARDRDQLWAEARVRFESGEKWWPSDDLFTLCKEQQSERTVGDTWTSIVWEWLDSERAKNVLSNNGGISTHDILVSAIGMHARDITRGDEMRVGEVFRELGWVSFRPNEDGQRVRRYRPRGTS